MQQSRGEGAQVHVETPVILDLANNGDEGLDVVRQEVPFLVELAVVALDQRG